MTAPDLHSAAQQVIRLLHGIADGQLTAPTPCTGTSVGALVDHVGGLSLAFTAAARKETGGAAAQAPSADAARLGEDWRERVPAALEELAEAWRDEGAWSGMTRAGGLELPGEVAGVVALDELVLHGWDLARSTGQRYEVDTETLEHVHGFVASFSEPGAEAQREGLFGPVVEVPDDAPLLDRVLGLSGRDPSWSPTLVRNVEQA